MRGLRLALLLVVVAALAAPAGAAGAAGWTLRQLPPKGFGGGVAERTVLTGVSCPTDSLCVAVGPLDTVAFSQSPSADAAAWHEVNPPAPADPGRTCAEESPQGPVPCATPSARLQGISCPSPSLCVAVSYEGFAYVSTDPTGGAGAWSVSDLNEAGAANTHLTAVSCPSPSLCVAVSGGVGGQAGRVLTTTDPTSGHWATAPLPGSLDLRAVSCAGPSLCVAVAQAGRIVVSGDPTGGAPAWRETGTPGGPGNLQAVDCVAGTLCAAGNATGNVLTSSDPLGGGWSEAEAGGSVQITAISCPAVDRCVAVDDNGDVLTSSDPSAGAGSWRFENLVPFHPDVEGQPVRNALFGASCSSTSLCTLVGADSRIFTATEPFAAVPPAPATGHHARHRGPLRPRTVLVLAEGFWNHTHTRRHRVRARFHFYAHSRVKGFECKRDHGRYRRCRSPLRYWVGRGRHVLRVRAIGPTGLRGPAALHRFRVSPPRHPR